MRRRHPHPLTTTGNWAAFVLGVGIMACLWLAGCTANRRVPPPSSPLAGQMVEAKPAVEQPPTPVTPPEPPAPFITEEDPDIKAALAKFIEKGKAPLIDKSKQGFVTFPYGKSQPVVRVRPLELTAVELEPGEEVLDLGAGDTERWKFKVVRYGPADHRVPVVLVKSTDVTADMTTTLTIGTSKRLYQIKLISRLNGPTIGAKFYYPDDFVRHLNHQEVAAYEEKKPVVSEFPAIPLDQLDFHYQVAGDAAFRPTQVFNDGTRTHIQLNTQGQGVPIVMVQTEQGQSLVQARQKKDPYSTDGMWIIVDGVPPALALISGSGNGRHVVTVTRGGDAYGR